MSQLISIRARKRGPRGVGCEQRQMEGWGEKRSHFFQAARIPSMIQSSFNAGSATATMTPVRNAYN